MTSPDMFDSIVSQEPGPYALESADGFLLSYVGVSPFIQTLPDDSTAPLYTFVYRNDQEEIVQVDINRDLHIVYLNGELQVAPFNSVRYAFKEVTFSLMLSTFRGEDKYKYSTPIFISESQLFGMISHLNYHRAEQIFKDRLLGAINFKITRNENGLVSVEACVVNKGEIPDFY